MTTEMNDQMQQLNKKMMLVIDEKDYQIKVCNKNKLQLEPLILCTHMFKFFCNNKFSV